MPQIKIWTYCVPLGYVRHHLHAWSKFLTTENAKVCRQKEAARVFPSVIVCSSHRYATWHNYTEVQNEIEQSLFAWIPCFCAPSLRLTYIRTAYCAVSFWFEKNLNSALPLPALVMTLKPFINAFYYYLWMLIQGDKIAKAVTTLNLCKHIP